jgi:hypothetical protein
MFLIWRLVIVDSRCGTSHIRVRDIQKRAAGPGADVG